MTQQHSSRSKPLQTLIGAGLVVLASALSLLALFRAYQRAVFP